MYSDLKSIRYVGNLSLSMALQGEKTCCRIANAAPGGCILAGDQPARDPSTPRIDRDSFLLVEPRSYKASRAFIQNLPNSPRRGRPSYLSHPPNLSPNYLQVMLISCDKRKKSKEREREKKGKQ